MPAHRFHTQIYYEDTDHSGVVYHANYLKFFERAREHMLGIDALVELYKEQNVGFVVYKANLTYNKGARFGDHLEICSTVLQESPYRLLFDQRAVLEHTVIVRAEIHLACVNHEHGLVKLPENVIQALEQSGYTSF